MDPVVGGWIASLGAEALKSWGAFAIVLMLLGLMLWLSEKRSKAKDAEIQALRTANGAEIEKLRLEIARLQDQRLQDAREMIRVAKNGTETMAARSAGDADFRELMRQLVIQIREVVPADPAKALPPPTINMAPS